MTPPPRPPARRRLRALGALLALAGGAALAAPAAVADPAQGQDPVVMAQLAVPVTDASAGAVAVRTGLRVESTLPEIGWAVYGIDGDIGAAHQRLLRDPAVTRIDFAAPGERSGLDFTPRDITMTEPGQVALGGVVAPWNWQWLKTNFPAAWDISRGSSSVRVAVIDSEFDTEHPDLKTKLATGRNLDSGTANYGTSNVRAETIDTAFHGSHVAGIVGAATDNGEGGPGACFDCVIIPFKIGFGGQPNVDDKFVRDLTEALVAAGNSDAAVINMSLGTSRDHPPLRAAVDYAVQRGKVVVASAGNSQLGGQGPAGVPNYPAAYPGVIAVASTRPDDSISPDSTNGDFVDIAAPGNPILSTWDTRLDANAGPELAPTHGIGYKVLAGTSMASPMVAGLAALMKTVRPDLSPAEVEGLMQGSADDLGAAGKDPVFGAGRINAARALAAARAYVRPTPPAPVVPVRAKVRIFYTCTVGARNARVGKPGRLGVRKGARLACKGRTAPALRRVQIEVQRFAARGGWKRIGKVKTNNRGRFGFTVRLRTVGNWTVRAAYGGNAALLPAGSLSAKVVVARRR
ncbi:MAG TPA: S8 family serine peptidase [Miltoncostaeaceae bacterium]|nr:S8 family serine peptidase [Miltoncostaeaceae bacterium]